MLIVDNVSIAVTHHVYADTGEVQQEVLHGKTHLGGPRVRQQDPSSPHIRHPQLLQPNSVSGVQEVVEGNHTTGRPV